jgi:MFS family permease
MGRSAPSAGEPGWLVKTVILLSAIPVALAFSVVTPILPKMSAALAHSAADAYLVKMVMGVVGIAMVLGSLLAGWLADKVDRRLVLAGAGLLFAAAGAAPFALDDLPLILASRLLMGVAAVTFYVAGAALIAVSFDEAGRAKWLGVSTAAAVVAGLVAVLLAGALGDLGWRWPFLICLVGAPLGLLSWVGLRDAPAPAGAKQAASAAAPAKHAPFPVALAVLGLLVGTLTYAPSIYLPFQLTALGAGAPSVIGQSIMAAMICTAVTSALFGRARLRLSARAAFCWSFAGVAVGLVVIATAPTYPIALVGLFIHGTGMGWLAPNLMTSAAGAVEESLRGRTLGVVKSVYSLAPALGVTALEPVANRIGPAGVLLLIAALSALMLLGAAATGLHRRTTREHEPA